MKNSHFNRTLQYVHISRINTPSCLLKLPKQLVQSFVQWHSHNSFEYFETLKLHGRGGSIIAVIKILHRELGSRHFLVRRRCIKGPKALTYLTFIMWISAPVLAGGTQWLRYCGVLSKGEFFIKMRASFLLSLSSINHGRMGARKAALIWKKNSPFDRTPQYG